MRRAVRFPTLQITTVLLAMTVLSSLHSSSSAQDSGTGFQRIEGKYVDVITDLPLDATLRELPEVFDIAVPQWCDAFGMQLDEVADWHCEAFIMLDKDRFRQAGMIPGHLPEFPYGFQFGDRLWVAEQPSAYYRRHLLLHEGTHWFMNRKYGNNGPPWLMEGMAEWFATHRWNSQSKTLSMRWIPESKDDVPYWGRIALIRDQLEAGLAPSLETVLRYGNTAHREVEAYAWSWAAVLFLQHHPRTQDTFQALLRRPMTQDLTLTRWMFARLRADWPSMRQEWNAMLSDLDYGYDPGVGMLALSKANSNEENAAVVVKADRGWQASGVWVEANTTLELSSDGRYIVGQNPKPWECTPDGVTLEYYRGEPLGRLLMTVVAPINREPPFALPPKTYSVGSQAKVRIAQAGELHFRINEGSHDLLDNQGQLEVHIKRQ